MLGIIIACLTVIGIVVGIIVSVCRTPDNLRGFYGTMFWTIGIIAIVGLVALVIFGLL